METSRTNAQYKRNDRYNLLYEIEWILSVLRIVFVRQTRQLQRYGNQALKLNFALSQVIHDYSMLITLYKIRELHFR